MLKRICFSLVVLLFAAVLLAPSPAVAQDCGTECVPCGWGLGYEGTQHSPTGPYNMDCYIFIPNCVACGHQQLVSDQTSEAARIADLVESVPTAHLVEALRPYRDRLLWNPRRNLLVIQGNGCDPKALASVVFLSVRATTALKVLGIRAAEN